MTLPQFLAVPSDFSNEALLSELPLGSHDAIIAGDTITTLHLNSEWRKFIAHAIDSYLDIGLLKASQSQLDVIDPLIHVLFDDFYSPDPPPPEPTVNDFIRANQDADQALVANVWTNLVWDVPTGNDENWDVGEFEVDPLVPDRVFWRGVDTIRVHVSANAHITAAIASRKELRILNSNNFVLAESSETILGQSFINVDTDLTMEQDDFIRVQALSTAAGTVLFATLKPSVAIHRIDR